MCLNSNTSRTLAGFPSRPGDPSYNFSANANDPTAEQLKQQQLNDLMSNPYALGSQILQSQIDLAPAVYNSEAKYQPLYADLQNKTLATTVLGTPAFDAAGALGSMSDDMRAQIATEAAKTGRTPEQWLTDHATQQAAAGDPGMQSLLKQYTSNKGGLLDIYQQATPVLGDIQSKANTQQRTADIADVASLGPAARAAYLAANPELTRTMGSLEGNVTAGLNRAAPQVSIGPLGSATHATGGPLLTQLEQDASANLGQVSPLQLEMQRQAMQQLSADGQLSAQDQRGVTQATRQAMADRGMALGNSAIYQEALNTDALQRQRRTEAQQAALGIDAAGQSQIAANRGYAQGVQAQDQALSGVNAGSDNQFALAEYGTQADLAKYNAALKMQSDQQALDNQFRLGSMYQSQATDPYQMVLGRSGSLNQAANSTTQGQQNLQDAGPGLFDPFNSSIMSLYNTQYNAANSQAIANGNNNAANNSAMIGGGASIATAIIAL